MYFLTSYHVSVIRRPLTENGLVCVEFMVGKVLQDRCLSEYFGFTHFTAVSMVMNTVVTWNTQRQRYCYSTLLEEMFAVIGLC
jgi:hypothetical protein